VVEFLDVDDVNTTCVLYEMLRGRWSFILHICYFGPLHSSLAFSGLVIWSVLFHSYIFSRPDIMTSL